MKRITPPLVLLAVAILAYGLLLPQLGFYWDDLPMSWVRYQLGAGAMTKYFSTNRPVWGLLYQVTTHLLPHVPIYWQLLALAFRWLGAVALWGIARQLFPQRERLALTLSLLFLLYPGFNGQWVSYLNSHFFIVIFFFLFSFYLTLRNKTIPALIFSALNLWMMEYFFVLELARPFLIWVTLEDSSSQRERFARTFKRWTPYLAVFALAVLSRLFIFNNQIYQFSLKEELAKAPVATMILLARNVFASLWTVTGAAWAQAFQLPDPIMDGPRTMALYGLTVALTGVAVFFGWRNSSPESTDYADKEKGNPPNQRNLRMAFNRLPRVAWILLGLGFVMLILGGPPFWLTNVPVSLGFPANRATMAFMFGSCFFLAGLFELIPSKARYVFIMIFINLAAGRHFLWANEYRRDWVAHKNFFWQLTWRAPSLEPDTTVLINEELEYYADNSMSAALNWVYAPDNHSSRMNYVLFYPTNRIDHSLPALQPNIPILYDYLAGKFYGNTSQMVVFYYAPPGCLRLLDPEIDSANRLIPDDSLLRDAALLSSTGPILTEPSARLPDVYGTEPNHGWCYYFEKADLARQLKDWDEVARLGDTAFALDDYPNDPIERFVFIEGYAHIGNWDKAKELSIASYRVSKSYVCPLLRILWNRIDRETAPSPEKSAALDELRIKFDCVK